MHPITNIAELKKAIHLLEIEQELKGQVLRNQFYLTYDSLKPVNLLSSTLRDLAKSPSLSNDFLGTAAALASGFISRKVFVGNSGNLLRKVVGTLIQFGTTDLVARHQDGIKSFGKGILQLIFQGKSNTSDPEKQ